MEDAQRQHSIIVNQIVISALLGANLCWHSVVLYSTVYSTAFVCLLYPNDLQPMRAYSEVKYCIDVLSHAGKIQ